MQEVKTDDFTASRETAPALVVVQTTLDDAAAARRLAAALVEARLAACAQCRAVHSVYRWKGGVETANEELVQVKTTADKAAAVRSFIAKRHPYELPEIAWYRIDATPAYVAWVREAVS